MKIAYSELARHVCVMIRDIKMKNKKLLVMAGGTGGHVFPAIAVAQTLQKQGWDICWLGTKDRMEAQLVPKYGIPIYFIQISGLRGKGLKALLTAREGMCQVLAVLLQNFVVYR